MRIFISILASLAFMILAPVSPSEAQNLTIALSPHVSESERQEQGEAVLRFLATHLEPGQSAEIINAYDLAPITTFAVPEGRAYQNPRAKLSVNRQAAAAVLRLEPDSERQANDVQHPIDLPGLLRYLGDTRTLAGGHDLIVIGSPIYDMPRERRVSMRGGRVPGDGLILGTRGSSPFGADGLANRLAGVRVHMVTLDPDWALNDRHAFAVERFTSLLVEAFGAQLVSFTNDMDSAFGIVAAGAAVPDRGFELEETDKLEMLIFAADMAPIASGRDMQDGTLLYTGPANVRGPVEIGLYWPCGSCDLDLHAQSAPNAAILSYMQISTAQGRLYKNFYMGQDDRRAREVVVLDGPVDLDALRVWVNFYAGTSARGADAELRFTIDGSTYVRPVHFDTAHGDHGAARQSVIDDGTPDEAWVAIQPLSLLRE